MRSRLREFDRTLNRIPRKVPDAPPLAPAVSVPLADAPARRSALEAAVRSCVARGAVVDLQQEFSAVLRYPRRVNHAVHAILSLLTFGLWLFVWLLLALTARDTRVTLAVDECGRVYEVQRRELSAR